MREASLDDILFAREERIRNQEKMIREFGAPLISFTMNIAGPVKNTPLIKMAFDEGTEMLEHAIASGGIRIWARRFRDEASGLEALYSADADVCLLKEICTEIEEGSGLGRLFDMDVIGADGVKISRAVERKCLICGAPGRACASRRIHTVEELQSRTVSIIKGYFEIKECDRVSEMVSSALKEEVLTTPKPGLVDSNNNGSHADMDADTFMRSIEALRPYWKRCMAIGIDTASDSPEHSFVLLRQAGIEAEKDMLSATGGINTHKGAIFLLGIICGAAGRLFDPEKRISDSRQIAEECAAMTNELLTKELAGIECKPEGSRTSGEQLWVDRGIAGARGEAINGLPSVIDTGLPVFEDLLARGMNRNDAGMGTLIALIASCKDTNMIKRGGFEMAVKAASAAAGMLGSGSYTDTFAVLELDRRFISMNLSPGGCADLLSVVYFLYDYAGHGNKECLTWETGQED